MYQIRLSDGAVLPVRFCAARDGVLTIDVVTDMGFMDVANLLSDPEKTAQITFLYGDMADLHEGYTHLFIINGATAGEYLVSLRRR